MYSTKSSNYTVLMSFNFITKTLQEVLGLPDFLQQNTGDFCLSVTFVKDNVMLFHVYVFVCSGRVTMAVS